MEAEIFRLKWNWFVIFSQRVGIWLNFTTYEVQKPVFTRKLTEASEFVQKFPEASDFTEEFPEVNEFIQKFVETKIYKKASEYLKRRKNKNLIL